MTEQATEVKNLQKVERLTPAVFEPKKIKKLVADIRREVLSLVPDASTEKGRKEVRSLAYKVSRTKTTLDNMGKDHVAEIKAKAKATDECRKTWRDAMDELRDQVLKPVIEYEQREENRVREIEDRIAHIRSFAQADDGEGRFFTSAELRDRRDQLHALDVDEDTFAEFTEKAHAQWGYVAKTIETLIAGAEAEEAKAAEEEALRQKQAEEAKAAEEKRIREEAAAQERARIEREQERKRIEEENARMQEEREAEALRAAEQKRIQNKQHRGKVNREIVASLQEHAGITEATAKAVVTAVAKGQIPGMTINY